MPINTIVYSVYHLDAFCVCFHLGNFATKTQSFSRAALYLSVEMYVQS
jgi:hypothetical protein